jgi:hypothetical protein
MATAGVAPRIMGIGPAPATRKVLELTGLALGQLDVIELNEAFAAQGLAVLRDLGIADDDARVNPNGGAIALGHPLGASGARLVTTASTSCTRSGGRYALCTMCIGVGQGIAVDRRARLDDARAAWRLPESGINLSERIHVPQQHPRRRSRASASPGRDADTLGPSDSSDSGSDVQGATRLKTEPEEGERQAARRRSSRTATATRRHRRARRGGSGRRAATAPTSPRPHRALEGRARLGRVDHRQRRLDRVARRRRANDGRRRRRDDAAATARALTSHRVLDELARRRDDVGGEPAGDQADDLEAEAGFWK